MYKLENITKRFNGQQVLKGVSLAVGEKEMISIMGKSGSGKSTLLGVMAGLIKTDGGRSCSRTGTFRLWTRRAWQGSGSST